MKTSPNDPPAPRKRGKAVFLIQNKRFFTESWGSRQGLRRSAKKAARGRSMKARPTQSRKGVKGQLPLAGSRDSVPCGVWGNAPTVSRETSISNALNKGAGSEASLPVTLRVRRRAHKLLFPQDSVKNQIKKRAAGATRFLLGLDDVLVSARGHGVQRGLAAGGAHAAVIQQRLIHRRERHDIFHLELL